MIPAQCRSVKLCSLQIKIMAEGFEQDEHWEKLIVGPTNFRYSVSRCGPFEVHSENFIGRWVLAGFQPVDNVATRYKSYSRTIQKAKGSFKKNKPKGLKVGKEELRSIGLMVNELNGQ